MAAKSPLFCRTRSGLFDLTSPTEIVVECGACPLLNESEQVVDARDCGSLAA